MSANDYYNNTKQQGGYYPPQGKQCSILMPKLDCAAGPPPGQGYYPQVCFVEGFPIYRPIFHAATAAILSRWLQWTTARISTGIPTKSRSTDSICVCSVFSMQYLFLTCCRQQPARSGGGEGGCMACLAGICLCCCAEGRRFHARYILTTFHSRTLRVYLLVRLWTLQS